MDTGTTPRRIRSGLLLRSAAALAVLVLLASLAGRSSPIPTTPASSSVAGSAVPGTAAPGSWARLTLPPDAAVADIQATHAIGRSITTTSAFTVRSLGAIGAAEIASRIVAEPAIRFTVEPGSDAASVTLSPAAPLRPGTRYRLRLTAPDGSLAGTWTFRTDQPLHIVTRLPDDQTTAVPVDTGIETTFDQDGATNVAAHFSIDPAVRGRFEQHGRTWVFVPDQPLADSTVYTVTVTHGVGVLGSDQVLESDVRWQFQTADPNGTPDVAPVMFTRPIVEFRPQVPIAIVVRASDDTGTFTQTSVSYELYRIPDLATASAAAMHLMAQPAWASWSRQQLVPTTGLTRVAAGTAALTGGAGTGTAVDSVRLPVQPDPGWYLLVLPGSDHPAQALVQVTDLAAYVLTTETRTAAWVNDLATQAPVVGATVAIAGGAQIARTDARGIATAPTPASLINHWVDWASWTTHLVVVTAPDGRQLLAPLGMNAEGYPAEDTGGVSDNPVDAWWLLLSTDRTTFRQADTIHAWGVIRSRADESVPSGLELRLSIPGQEDAPIARMPITASARGVFAGDLSFRDLPTGSYSVSLYAGATRIQSTWVEVAVIRKPAYQIEVRTDHWAYVAGDPIAVSGDVSFYDGSHAPGFALQAAVENDSPTRTSANATTTADGSFQARFANPWNPAWGTAGATPVNVAVHPTGPEEGAISGSATVLMYPAALWLQGAAELRGTTLDVSGSVARLDLAGVDRAMAAGNWPDDPSGGPLVGHTVQATVIHEVPVRTQVGTTYDFIAKKVVPNYQYSYRSETIRRVTLTTDANGTFDLSLNVPVATDQYEIWLTSTDSKGRDMTIQSWTGQTVARGTLTTPYLVGTAPCESEAQLTAPVGGTTDLTVHEGDGSLGAAGRYLFLVGEQGLVDTVLQPGPTLSRTFQVSDLPSYTVQAVRLTDHGYQATNPTLVTVDLASKALHVAVTAERARYAPGETATVDIVTTDPNGHPTSADVVVRAVDEKLFTIGDAIDIDALRELMTAQDSGFLQSFTSHPSPFLLEGGCGGAGGTRDDFRDSATFQHVQTDASGHASVSFGLPDDLTSWHVSATAVDANLDAGSGTVLVPVGLPFFVDAIAAPEYLAGETPSILVRAYGDAVRAGDPVRFVLDAPDLGIAGRSVTGKVGTPLAIALPALPAGDHRITVSATSGDGARADAIVRTIRVVPTRLSTTQIRQQVLAAGGLQTGATGMTTYVVSDAGRGSLLPILDEVLVGDGARFDQSAGAAAARQLLMDEFDVPQDALPDPTYDASRYARGGISLLPYSSPDLSLTALAALTVPDLIDPSEARGALDEWLAGDPTRERRIIALAGSAALGGDVLDDLLALESSDLTVREQIWLGLGYLASGDETDARRMERQVLASAGERLDPWVRVSAGADVELTLEATALEMVLSSELGDPLAAGMAAYVRSQPSRDHVFPLEEIGYVRGGLDRLSRSAVSFAWTVDGQRHEEHLDPGAAWSVRLTPAQVAGLSFQPGTGDATITTTWLGDASAADLPSTPGLSITRSVSPANDAPSNGIVRVQLTVTFGASLPDDCYAVTDLLPSGLAPLVNVPGWPDDSDVPRDALAPYAADGQRVSWCVGPSDKRTMTLVYAARVVTPGTYRWEPAVVQSATAPSIGAATAATTYTIR